MIQKTKEYAIRCHTGTNHLYDGKPYSYHLNMVYNVGLKYIYLIPEAYKDVVLSACWAHDVIEDTRQTYNDVKAETNTLIAELVYALTNEKGRTRKDRANDKYYQGIRETPFAVFVKLCDRIANFEYSLQVNSSMANSYKRENEHFMNSLWDPYYEDMFNHLKSLTVKM